MFSALRCLAFEAVARALRGLPNFTGKVRLARAAAALLRGPRATRVEAAGVRFEVDARELIDFNLAFLGAHEPANVRALAARIEARGHKVLWDVGANVGAIALPLLRRFDALALRAFEPSPRVAGRLLANLKLNPALAARAKVFTVALSDQGGVAEFFLSYSDQNQGLGSFGALGDAQGFHVCAMTGDEMIARGYVERPQLMKVDVEGFELEVFKGLEKTLRDGPAVDILFEHCAYRFAAHRRPLDACFAYLAGLGYRFERVTESGALMPYGGPGDLATDADFLATRPASAAP